MGDGDIRLTVWQNLLISGVPTDKLGARRSRDRGARPHHQGELDPRRPRRLHRQHRLPVRGLRHQAPRRGDRALVRGARRARRAGEHPSHRLPSFLRAALHRRHRPARLQGADLRGRRRRRGLSHPGRRRLRAGRGASPASSTATSRPRTRRATIERMLKTYLARRASRDESFQAFTRRHEIAALTGMFAEAAP